MMTAQHDHTAFRHSVFDLLKMRSAATVAVALTCVVHLTSCATQAQPASDLSLVPPIPEVEAVFGIRPMSLHLSSAGSMLDFRYKVVDPAKAAPMLNGKIQPYLVDEKHSAKLGVPDTPILGRIRQTSRNGKILMNRNYFVMFGNPGKAVQSGDTVTLLLGEMKITDLKVQ